MVKKKLPVTRFSLLAPLPGTAHVIGINLAELVDVNIFLQYPHSFSNECLARGVCFLFPTQV
jgi:hypothetical protein